MNILFLCQYNPYVGIGASANRFRGLIDGLCKLGHKVTIGIVGGLKQKGEEGLVEKKAGGLEFVYLSHGNNYSYIQNRLNVYLLDDTINPIIVRTRLRRLLKQQYDIVWLTQSDLVLNLFNKEKKHIQGKTFIELNEFNDLYKEVGNSGNFLQRRKGKNRNELFLKAVRYIDLFAVMTNTLIDHYSKIANPKAKFMLLPMTVDLSRFNGLSNKESAYQRPYIAFTGTMNNHKDGVDILIKAFAKVADKYSTFHLYLAGFRHYDVPMQKQLIADFGLQERIHYIGVLNRDQIPTFICNATVLALSRPDSHQAQGGFPTKLGEYLASGNPVCVTKVGEIPDYLEDNVSAFMATPGDVDSFADAMDRALRDQANAKVVGLNGRKIAEQSFDSNIQAKRLSEFLMENLA